MFEFLEQREKEFEMLVEKLELPDSIKTLPYNLLGNPYHNSHHLRTVALNSYKIAKQEGISDELQKVAFVAGAMHDTSYVHHTQEALNIDIATKEFVSMCAELSWSQELIDYGVKLIINTRSDVPKVYVEEHSDMWIVHDADLSVWFDICSYEAHYLCSGIEVELNIPTNCETTKKFLKSHGMGTFTGKEMLEKFLRSPIKPKERWIAYG